MKLLIFQHFKQENREMTFFLSAIVAKSPVHGNSHSSLFCVDIRRQLFIIFFHFFISLHSKKPWCQ